MVGSPSGGAILWCGALLVLVGAAASQQLPPPAPARPSLAAANLYLPAGHGQGLPSPPVTYNISSAPYNAKGDGQTDDTSAIKAAIADANANKAGGVIYLPAGTYVLREPIVIERAGVVLRGDGEGTTTIRIPVSLSDVYAGTWTIDSDGKITSSWSFGGAFFLFKGRTPRSYHTDSRLAAVTGTAPQGAFRLQVDSTFKLFVGQWVRVFVNDDSTAAGRRRRLLSALRRRSLLSTNSTVSVTTVTDATTGSSIQLVTRQPPDWLQQDAVYQAAMEGAALFGAFDEEGVTAAQALAADKAAIQESGMVVAAAAAPGTVVAWLYGDGLADSGQPSAVDTDEVSLSAKVSAVGSNWIELDRELPFPVKAGWDTVVHSYYPTVQNGGMEKMTIAFDHSMVGPHFTDRGYNAMEFKAVANMWVSKVTVLNADNALFTSWADRSTFEDVTVDVTQRRWVDAEFKDSENGHHAIGITHAHSNRIDRFNIAAKYIHDLTVSSGASLNVFTRGRGRDLNLDHHRAGPYANLFTDVDVGYGLRPFASGGRKDRAAHSALGTTFWNLRAIANAPPPLQWPPPSPPPRPPPPRPKPRPPPRLLAQPRQLGPTNQQAEGGQAAAAAARGRRLVSIATLRPLGLPDCDFGPYLNFYGSFTGNQCAAMGWLVAPLNASMPSNLWLAQTAARRAAARR
ncbi:hypothetical protein CHLNCDRAFT_145493 [Chlorella variabilis]|uniref:Rhamnogalacturonase A/B/Epimerase-like pectate lyase domain-containing protein n=1 Tax=Chlorella variabilis TaxID=554065 RepID=E1ZDL7_CHLVA|nr:hypothetical protein CHLNCDRAFT_145493 [Chlorella variabilis]EFN56045.1 hypothetical protein CHLNCDRAFT_145493 [Chlorella variabilis]|eukprot:XP_005848147.1 hypothetical protein CHLNCDRAFT_145493 [Chlorella variabilis]